MSSSAQMRRPSYELTRPCDEGSRTILNSLEGPVDFWFGQRTPTVGEKDPADFAVVVVTRKKVIVLGAQARQRAGRSRTMVNDLRKKKAKQITRRSIDQKGSESKMVAPWLKRKRLRGCSSKKAEPERVFRASA